MQNKNGDIFPKNGKTLLPGAGERGTQQTSSKREKTYSKSSRIPLSKTENVVSSLHPFKTVTRWTAEIENALYDLNRLSSVEINLSTTVPALLALMHVQSRGHVFISNHEVSGKCLFGDFHKNQESDLHVTNGDNNFYNDPSAQIEYTCRSLQYWLEKGRSPEGKDVVGDYDTALSRHHYQYDMVEIGTAVTWLMVYSQAKPQDGTSFKDITEHKDRIQHIYKKMPALWSEYSKWYKSWVDQGKPMFRGYIPISGSVDGETVEEEFMLAAHRCQHFNTPFGDRVYGSNLELINLFSNSAHKESDDSDISALD